jgi:hypothetical protein
VAILPVHQDLDNADLALLRQVIAAWEHAGK